MSTRVNNIYRIIAAIAIQVQSIDGFGIQVGSVVRGDESAPLGGVIPSVAVVQTRIVIVVIATVTDGVCVGDGVVGGAGSDGAIVFTYILTFSPPAVKKKPPRP